MVQVLIIGEALLILTLLAALIVGQPAATQADHDKLAANATTIAAGATDVARLRAALPVSTRSVRLCPGYVAC